MMNNTVNTRANKWLTGKFDSETKARVKYLMENDEAELSDAFYRDLEFGTGGLRGVMGVGTNRMNKYTVGMTTQGLANYLKQVLADEVQIKVAIGYDSRNNSKFFARITAEVFSANGIKVYLFDELRPLPVLSFAIRHLGCHSGVVITASHNPKEYNGYKVFWSDGGQIVAPHDKKIIQEVKKITEIADVKFDGDAKNIEIIGEEIDREYLPKIKAMSHIPEIIAKHKDLKIVYTPIHGSGYRLVPTILKNLGFENIFHVPEQDVIDGNFPTVKYPNPEEKAGLKLAIERARETDAEIVLATDPDADRVAVAVAVRDRNNEFVILTGNQTASLLVYYLITQWKNKGKLRGREYIVKTIVTTELLKEIAHKFGVECFDVLTGFKWISDIIKRNEGQKTFIFGGEESIGFLCGDFVRDKDAVFSSAMIAETAAWAAENGKSLYELLIELYVEFGAFKSHLHSIIKKGATGAEEIGKMMVNYRDNPGSTINNSKIVRIIDYELGTNRDLVAGTEQAIRDLPKSNVIQFFLADASKISVRPSGTEPKIKYYFEVKAELESGDRFERVNQLLEERIEAMIASMGIG